MVFLLIDHSHRRPQNESALEFSVPPVNRLPRFLRSYFPHRPLLPAQIYRALFISALLWLAVFSVGCAGKKQTANKVPPAPSLPSGANSSNSAEMNPGVPTASVPGIHVDPNARAIWSEVGFASWYGPNYDNKKGANGEIYHQNEMTAAHNTLPLNSIVRVVNLKSNQSTVVRITDRGPFVTDRIIDLSVAAAKALNVYLPGTAKVRLDVLEAPRPIETGGRWCVQIGAFQSHSAAVHMKNHLLHRYPGSQVIEFQGPTGYWVRIRVPQDDKQKTREVFDDTHVAEGAVFMVRLD